MSAQTTCIPVYIKEFLGNGHTEPRDIKYLPDGNALVAGRGSASPPGDYDGFVSKISSNGTVVWSYLIGGTADDRFTGICPLNDGTFILYGTTTSFGNVSAKTFIVHINTAGNLLNSYQVLPAGTSADQPKKIIQFTDGDIIGTVNTNDSTPASDPVVFKMSVNGAMRWSRRFDNGKDDSFTSLAYNGSDIYVGGYFTRTSRRAVMIRLKASDGTISSSEMLYRQAEPVNEEIVGIEIKNNILSYGIHHLWKYDNFNNYVSGLLLLQFDVNGTNRYQRYIPGGDSTVPDIRRTPDNGFFILQPERGNAGNPHVVKISNVGLTLWGNLFYRYESNTHNYALDVTPDGGYISAGYRRWYFTNELNEMKVMRVNEMGEGPDCLPGHIGAHNDTGTFRRTPLTWTTSAQHTVQTSNTNAVLSSATLNTTVTCDSSYCVDRTPLPETCNETFRLEYSSLRNITLRDVVSTTDGGRIGIGNIDGKALALKYKANGDVEWAKSYNIFYHDMLFRRIIRTFDDQYLIVGLDAWVLNHGANATTIMMKIDVNGNVTWSNNFNNDRSGYRFEPADILQTNDGGFLMLMNEAYGTGSLYTFVIRFDRNLNMIWRKELKHFAAAPIYRSISCDGKSIYIAYDSYDYYNYPNFGVDKLDYATGNKIWTNRYATGTDNVIRVNKVHTINDTAFVFLNNFVPVGPFNSILGTLLVKLHPNGTILKATHIETGSMMNVDTYDYLDISPPTVAKTGNNEFVIASQIKHQNRKALNITKLRPDASSIWSRNYFDMGEYSVYNVRNHGDGFVMVGTVARPKAEKPWFDVGFMLKVDSAGYFDSAPQAECVPEPMVVTTRSASITDHWPAVDSIVNATTLEFRSISLLMEGVDVDATLFCHKPTICGSVALKEMGGSCSANDTLVYYLEGGVDCGSMAKWFYDPNFFSVVKQTGDTLKLKPLKSGTSDIRVEIEGNCFLNVQQLTASVLVDASAVNLGNDTLLCPNGTIKLNARKGYETYLWNDLSTDSILTINQPGRYFVTVTDKCGGSYADTVIVSSADLAFNVSEDTTKCNNDAIQLRATSGFSKYQWSPQSAIASANHTATVNPSQTTRYYASAEIFAGCRVSDSVLVTVLHSPALHIQGDTEICSGDSTLIAVDGGFDSYLWNSGETGVAVFGKNEGWYKVAATYSNGCVSRDSFELKTLYTLPKPDLNKNGILCRDEVRTLDAGSFYNYTWNDGSSSRTKNVTDVGTYWVSVTDDHGCIGTDTTSIRQIVPRPSDFLPEMLEKCQYGNEIIGAGQTYQSYTWSDQSAASSITVSQPGVYWLLVKDANNCEGRDTVRVIEKQCAVGVFVPNAFTPNNDGNNDDFKPVVMGEATSYQFSVFNRWGIKVFETTSIEKAWDGRVNGILSDGGTFVWYCVYTLAGQNKAIKKGYVQLIR